MESVVYQLGESVAKLHNNHIIHGDLTSSNIMINLEKEEKIFLIDFGLSFISENTENKAVDLFVFEKSLFCEKNSSRFADELLKIFWVGYKKHSN